MEQRCVADIRSYHGTNAVCGCWSKCVVVGVGSIYSSVTVGTHNKKKRMVKRHVNIEIYVNKK